MPTQAKIEREKLCDLLIDVGPDAPTLCGCWTTRDLAAHLVVRERRPDGAVGILAKPLAGYAEKVRLQEAGRDYADLVERVRSGPPRFTPWAVPMVDRLVNTIEFFVHHEDVRRAAPGWTPRQLGTELEHDLLTPFKRGVRMLARKSPAGVLLRPDGNGEIVAKRPREGTEPVVATAPLGELVMFMYGRQDHANVDLGGPSGAVEAIRTAEFGI